MPDQRYPPRGRGLFDADQGSGESARPVGSGVPRAAPRDVLSVSALLANVRDVLEHRFPVARVAGEISNFTPARSGHLYFVLKDATSQVRCVMFRSRAQYLDWPARDGDRVEVRGAISIYDARGDLQLNIDAMRRAGAGALYEAFLALRDRLSAEGLFDEAAKRPLPAYPRAIGIVTSPGAAALRDVLTTLRRRNPAIPVILYPTAVQGAGAAPEIVAAIGRATARAECDVLVVGRGGGSIEDLWAFNDERVARAIRACGMPVVTGIGHQTDFTIADFAADVRAPTPTAAAELVSPPRAALLARTAELTGRLARRTRHRLEDAMQRLDFLTRRLAHPRDRLLAQEARVASAATRVAAAGARALESRRWALAALARRQSAALPGIAPLRRATSTLALRAPAAAKAGHERARARLAALEQALAHLDPRAVLERGYSITTDAEGRVLTDALGVELDARVRVRLARGTLDATVTDRRPASG
jgi:exodeoxyribonuclease VII large subunit